MARDTLGYQYTGEDDTSRMTGGEINDDDIVERLGRIFKDMPPYTPCPVPEYSATHPPNEVSIPKAAARIATAIPPTTKATTR
jgi:hypothetical protein